MGFINERDENGHLHTIDKERDIILKSFSSHPDHGCESKLIYKGHKIRIKGRLSAKMHQENGKYTRKCNVAWHFYEMSMIEELKEEQEEIQKILQEALEVMGYLFDEKITNSVTVKFSLPQHK